MAIEVRRIRADEWKEYKGIRLRGLESEPLAFMRSYYEEKGRPDEYWKRLVLQMAANPLDHMLVALRDGTMVGSTGLLYGFTAKTRHVATICNVYVDNLYRGQGIARKLFQAALDVAQGDRLVRKIKLTVNPAQEAAVQLYLSFGFVKTAVLEGELMVDNELYDEWVMEKQVS